MFQQLKTKPNNAVSGGLVLFFCLFSTFAFAQTFSDVAPDYWAYSYIEAGYRAGLFSGYPDKTYHPEEQVTRAQMAVFIQKAKGLPLYSGAQIFTDVASTYWAFGSIGAVYQAGIVLGYPNGDGTVRYEPETVLTRAQMAVFLARAVRLDTSIYNPADSTTWAANFTDVTTTYWAWKEIQAVAGAQIALGYSPTTYAPETKLTRAMMAVFMCRAFNVKAVDTADATPPSVSITSPAAGATVSKTLSIQATSSDNIAVMKVGFYLDDVLVLTDVKAPYAYSWDTTKYTEDTHTIKVIAIDSSYNYNNASITLKVDNTAPTGTIKINNDNQYTNATSVTLNLSAADSGSGMGTGAQMQFSNDGTTWSTTEAYATTKSWTLTTGDGIKTVYVKFKDVAGNWSIPLSDTIIMDITKPTVTITSPQDGQIITDTSLNPAVKQKSKSRSSLFR